jgi:hypothetical protein
MVALESTRTTSERRWCLPVLSKVVEQAGWTQDGAKVASDPKGPRAGRIKHKGRREMKIPEDRMRALEEFEFYIQLAQSKEEFDVNKCEVLVYGSDCDIIPE